ncbi:MAG: ABC transporter permease [Bacteroidetes bacterium]|nr:ABC transporter permease [Bacteroidota bacterium]
MPRASEIAESFRIAVSSVRANLMRSILTTSGIVVGIFFVVLMGVFIKGLDAVWEKTISIIGKDMIYVDKWDWAGGHSWRKAETRKDITFEQAEALCARLEAPELAMPLARRWGGSVMVGNKSMNCSVMGTTSLYGQTPAGEIESGRFFNPMEEQQGTNVTVIGYGVAKTFFPDGNAVGQTIKIKGFPFRIIGTIAKRGFLFMDFIDNQAFISLEAFKSVYGFQDRNFEVGIKAGNERMLDLVRDEAVGVMRQIRNVPPGAPDDFSVNEMKAFDSQAAAIRLGIWVVGIVLTALSFVVGAIGIMNIMFVSVTERTKEIGIRKAIGARRSSILMQFLLESSLLCIAGALIAIPLVQIVVFSIRFFLLNILEIEAIEAVSPLLPLDLLAIAIAVSIFVGLVAGIFPAIKAAFMNPVDALRFE